MSSVIRKLLWSAVAASVSFSAYSARDVSQIHLEPGDGNWSLGLGFRMGTFPYVGKDEVDDLLPLITYNGERFFIDGSRFGVHLYRDDDWLIGTYASYRFAGFNETDAIELDGLDRDDSVDGRFAISRFTKFGDFTLDFGHDIGNKSNGWDADFRWGKVFERGNYRIRPWIGIAFESQDLTQYYYGVEADEVTENRHQYTTSAAAEWRYGIDMSYRLGQHHFVGFNMQYSQLDSTKINSPIVVDKGQYSAFASYRYEFNDYQDDPYVNGNIVKDLTKGEWYWRVAAGRFTSTSFKSLIFFQDFFKEEPRGTGLASLFVGKKIADSFMSLPLDVYATAGFARHFEKGYQDNFNEYILGFKAYYSDFPWSDKIKTRFGFGEGVSFASKVPFVEAEEVGSKNRKASKFLNYLDWSWDVSVGDVFNAPKLKECYFGWSIHHRSGIFASADFFGNVNGGSNVNTLYLQCHNH